MSTLHQSLRSPRRSALKVTKAAAGLILVVSAALTGLAGCASDRPQDVPKTAALKAEGDQRVVYAAEQDGTVWVTERGSNDILYSGQVTRGDRLTLDPDAGKLLLNDGVVADKGVGHIDHKVFFLPGPPVPSPSPAAVAAARDAALARPAQVPANAVVKGEGKDRVEYTAD